MGPLILATGRNEERMRQTRKELLARMLADPVEAKKLCKAAHQPTAYEIGDAVDAMIEDSSKHPTFVNEKYQVQVRPCECFSDTWPEMVWLSIRRQDRGDDFDWREMQEIKNQLVGEENEGVELFPAESRLVDISNQRHTFVFKDPTVRLPFGFNERKVDGFELSTAKQRPRSV